MDPSLAFRLDSKNAHHDAELFRKCAQIPLDYVKSGLATQSFYLGDFDAAYDLADALAALPIGTNSTQYDKQDRSASSNFSHPCGATEVDVMATAVSQINYGGESNRKVQARRPDAETKADAMNQMLAWNDSQQDTYVDGFLFTKDCIVARGIQYDFWCDQYENVREPVEYEIPQGNDPPMKATRFKMIKKKVGGFTKIVNISPYDFVSDPTIPLSRFQESRYAGHRVMIPWQELDRRSKLPVTDYQYVLPAVVAKLKNQKVGTGVSAIGPQSSITSTSRTFFERQRRGYQPTPDTGIAEKVNKDDGGVVECWCMYVRLRPKEHGIYEDEEQEIVEFLLANQTDLLSVNVMDNQHGDYPYAVGEARPNAHRQFAPSLAMLLKPTQNMIDVRKSAHEEQVERSGMLLLGRGTKCDIAQMLQDKTRIRQVVMTTEEAEGTPLNDILLQIPLRDSTATFPDEMDRLEATMEKTSGAHSSVQGATQDPSQTLGQFQETNEMAMGRISTVARNISSRALLRQTRRIAMNLQQWMSDEQTVKIVGQPKDFDPDVPPPTYVTVRREPVPPEQQAQYDASVQQAISQGLQPPPPPPGFDHVDIQFEFDVEPHDGAMPGIDQRAVAAASRLIEAAANPAFAACFDNTVPGNYDPRALITYVAEKSGMPVQNFRITTETARKNTLAKMQSQGLGIQPQQPPGAAGAPAPIGPPPPTIPLGGSMSLSSAGALPQTPSAAPPQASGVSLQP